MTSGRERRGFTLIELLVIVGIIGAMVTMSVVSIRAGQDAARVKGAARDVFATIRHARSLALVTQQPAVITYSTETVDGEPQAKITIDSAKIMNSGPAERVETLSGEIVSAGGGGGDGGGGGQSVEEILFAPIAEDVVRGVRLKVLADGEELEPTISEEARSSKISVFSTSGVIIDQYRRAQEKKSKGEGEGEAESKSKGEVEVEGVGEGEEPFSVVWEVNGRTDPHKVWVHLDGETPDKGLCIRIDRFGAAKILAAGEEDD